jgi:hypothetical protein
MKLSPVGAELFHVDRQTFDEANSRSLQFCERVQKLVITINIHVIYDF